MSTGPRYIKWREHILICDEEDYELLCAKLSTIVVKADGRPSYVAIVLETGPIKFHRYLMNPPEGLYIDHINGNPLDNRKCNLRICTNSQNQMNARSPITKKSKLPKGVSKSKSNPGNPFQVRISYDGIRVQIGYFKTIEEAEAAYKKAAEFYQGSFAFHLSRKEK